MVASCFQNAVTNHTTKAITPMKLHIKLVKIHGELFDLCNEQESWKQTHTATTNSLSTFVLKNLHL